MIHVSAKERPQRVHAPCGLLVSALGEAAPSPPWELVKWFGGSVVKWLGAADFRACARRWLVIYFIKLSFDTVAIVA